MASLAVAHISVPVLHSNSDSVPEEPLTELRSLAAYRKTHSNRCLLCTYAQQEVAKRERVVVLDEESGFVALVPFWATWPFEIMVLPYKRHITDLTAITEDEALGLARVLKKVLTRYDNLFTSVPQTICSALVEFLKLNIGSAANFSTPFPYSMGIHQAPLPPLAQGQGQKTSDDHPAHFHIHFYPPLLRSSSVRKFLVGFEMMAEAQVSSLLTESDEYPFMPS
jgi:UDPglucose--hexose-1-phosphate uridylyltransferase